MTTPLHPFLSRFLAIILLLTLASPSLAQYQYIKTVEMWPMRDGVRLSTTVYRPVTLNKSPVVIMRTPYLKDTAGDDGTGAAWVQQGYVFIIQNTRGRFSSEGEDGIFRDDGWGLHQDGYDTVERAGTSSWSNGNVALYGASASAITGEMAAGASPPHLEAEILFVGSNDCYEQLFFEGGTLRSELIENWLRAQGQYDDEMPRFAAHPTDDSFWEQYDALARAPQVNVPAVFIGGWYDILSKGTLDGFVARQTLGGPQCRGENFLWMGPWTHGGLFSTAQGQLTYPASAADPSAWTLVLQFLDHHLRGGPRPAYAAVTYYRMGPTDAPSPAWNQYVTASSWPPAAGQRPMYLHADGSMSLSPRFDYWFFDYYSDPANPVPTIGGPNLNIAAGPFDQQAIEARPDTIEFQTAPMVTPMEITGNVKARLYVQSDSPDFDLCVRMTDVYPDGRSMLVLDGVRRARFRNGYKTEQLVPYAELTPIEVDLLSTSIVIAPGHRLRISISGSNSPRFDVNPNTGEPFRQNTSTHKSLTRVWVAGWAPSALLLPANTQLLNRR